MKKLIEILRQNGERFVDRLGDQEVKDGLKCFVGVLKIAIEKRSFLEWSDSRFKSVVSVARALVGTCYNLRSKPTGFNRVNLQLPIKQGVSLTREHNIIFWKIMEFISPEGLRLDGRRPLELRQLNGQVGVIDKADGSAIFEMGNTKVMVAVYGPHEVHNKSQQQHDHALVRCEFSLANFSTGDRSRHFKGDRKSTEMSLVIRQTMEATILTHHMPRSQIDIFVQVLQSDGGVKSACINAAVLAVADAGIPMRELLASCSAGYLNSTPVLDMNYVEESAGGPVVTVGHLAKTDKITLLQMDSKLPMEIFETVMQLAIDGCMEIVRYIQKVLLENTIQLEFQKGLKI